MSDEFCERCGEQLSDLINGELEPTERRGVALHAATCEHCSRLLGQLYATRTALQVPRPTRVALPRAFWRRVREGLDSVDRVILATDVAPQRRPLVSPGVLATCLAVVALALVAKSFLLASPNMPEELSRVHLAATGNPHDAGFYHPVGIRTSNRWRPVARRVIDCGGCMTMQSLYDVGGLPISVFRVAGEQFDVSRLATVELGPHRLYVGGFGSSSLAAVERQDGWDVIVARTPPGDLISLALTAPPTNVALDGM